MIVEEYLHVPKMVAHGLKRMFWREDYDDLKSVANLKFIEALEKYNAEEHGDFGAYSYNRTKFDVIDHYRQILGRQGQKIIHTTSMFDIARETELYTHTASVDNVEHEAETRVTFDEVLKLLRANFEPREQEIFMSYYTHESLEQLAERWGISSARVCQIRGKVTQILRSKIGSNG